MPFDGTSLDAQSLLYLDRRQRAADEIRNIKHFRFNIESFQCGTTVCAIGRLCEIGFDGWHFVSHNTPKWGHSYDSDAIVKYFGITEEQAEQVFYSEGYDINPKEITPDMVADRLLAL